MMDTRKEREREVWKGSDRERKEVNFLNLSLYTDFKSGHTSFVPLHQFFN
jgi:hypothetical protein